MIHTRRLSWPLMLWIACVLPSFALAQSVSDYAVRISATVQTNPPRITLAWPGDARATGYTLYRKLRDQTSWGTGTSLATNATSYVDSNVAVGDAYEYRISKSASGYSGHGYCYAGMELPLIEERGTVILVVDSTHAAALTMELARLQQDLVGDGWTVWRHDVSRTETVPNVKALIAADYAADPANVKAVFLIGHVSVPYAGSLAPDGHSNHVGAWPADVFYGELNGNWTDATVTSTNASSTRNWNVPGDGKYDQSSLPSDAELAVGRVDFANLPAFALSESGLLRQYLNKDHNFRHGRLPVERRGLVDDSFGTYSGGFADSAWRNFAACFGAANTFSRDWFPTLATAGYLWGYGAGAGSFTSASGVGNTAQFATNDPQVVFTMLFGSYFGDWDSQNNFMRAALATPTYTLACAWDGRPHWFFHHAALGETLGFSTRLSQNNASLYQPSGFSRQVHIALLGDPTLRMHPVPPPSALRVVADGQGGAWLQWSPPPVAGAGYHLYRAAAVAGPYARLNDALLTDTNYFAAHSSASFFMVRAVVLESSASGSYFNASQGIFQSLDGTFGTPGIAMLRPAAGSRYIAPATIPIEISTVDYANYIQSVQFYADEVLIGEDGTPPFSLTWSNVPVGSYSLTARAVGGGGFTTNTGAVAVQVEATIVAAGAVWKYLDDGSDQGMTWRTLGFDDRTWTSGPAELGYSNSPVTVVDFGPDPANKYITTYFRHVFTVDDPTGFTDLTLGLLRDDGAVVHFNGTEVFRSNLPGGTISYQTRALTAVGGADESVFYETNVSPALLVAGANVLAVELHQQAPSSSDLGFNLYLLGNGRLPPPRLGLRREGSRLLVSWPASAVGYRLETATFAFPAGWQPGPISQATSNGLQWTSFDLNRSRQYFRLVKP